MPSLRLGLALVVAVLMLGLLGPLLATVSPDEQIDPPSAGERRPGTRLYLVELAGGRRWLVDEVQRTPDGLRVRRLGATSELAAAEVANLTATGVDAERRFPLGSDRYGRDLLARLLHGLRLSLVLGLAAGVVALLLGVLVGAVAATGGPGVDAVLMRLVDALMAFPKLFLILALAALFRPSTVLLAVVLGGTRWMTISRLVRASIRETRERDFVLAARGLGLHRGRILLFHLLPSSLAPVLALASLTIGVVILGESVLSFLGFGVQPPAASLGSIINDGQASLTTAWWVATFPGILILVTVLGFNLLADGLRDVLDPRLEAGTGG